MDGSIIGEHLAHLLLGEAHHFVEAVGKGVVCADVEAAGQVVECHRADTCHEDTLDRGICT